MNRLHLGNGFYFVEFANNSTGWLQIRAYRKAHPIFKGCRITQILQMYPRLVPLGELMEYE